MSRSKSTQRIWRRVRRKERDSCLPHSWNGEVGWSPLIETTQVPVQGLPQLEGSVLCQSPHFSIPLNHESMWCRRNVVGSFLKSCKPLAGRQIASRASLTSTLCHVFEQRLPKATGTSPRLLQKPASSDLPDLLDLVEGKWETPQ